MTLIQISGEIILLVGLTFLFRILFLTAKDIASGGNTENDFHFHRWYIKVFAENNSIFKRFFSKSINKGILSYPPLPHAAISKFPKKYWVLAGLLGNQLYDVIAGIIFYFLVNYLSSDYQIEEFISGISNGFFFAVIIVTIPLLSPVNNRLTGMGGRTLGPLLVWIYFILAGGVLIDEKYWLLIPAALIANLIILSSKFGTQCLVLFSIGLSIGLKSIIPLGLCLLFILTGSIIKPLGVGWQLKVMYFRLKFYSTVKMAFVEFRNNWTNFIFYLKSFPKKPFKSYHYFTTKISVLIILLGCPGLIVFFGLGLYDWEVFQLLRSSSYFEYILILIYSGIGSFILTSFKPFDIIGEAERYIEYVSPAVYLGLLFILNQQNQLTPLLFYLFIFHLIIILNNYLLTNPNRLINNLSNSKVNVLNPLRELLDFLYEFDAKTFWCIHQKLSLILSYYLTFDYNFYFNGIMDENQGREPFKEDFLIYGYCIPDINHFKTKYGVEGFIIQKNKFHYYEQNNIEFGFIEEQKVFENDVFVVYDVRNKK